MQASHLILLSTKYRDTNADVVDESIQVKNETVDSSPARETTTESKLEQHIEYDDTDFDHVHGKIFYFVLCNRA